MNQVKWTQTDSKLRMNKFLSVMALVLATFLSGCGGGGGGGNVNEQVVNSIETTYSVSTLSLSQPLSSPFGISSDSSGNLFVSDTSANLILKLSNLTSATVSVSAYLGDLVSPGSDYSTCDNSNLYSPFGVVVDNFGDLYLTESGKNAARYADCNRALLSNTFSAQYGDQSLSGPKGVALYGDNLYVSDTGNHRIKLISKTSRGVGSTRLLAGTTSGYVNGALLSAAFAQPTGLVVSSGGDVFVADTNNCAIRRISSNEVSTFAGAGPNQAGSVCDSSDGAATVARFKYPTGIAIDARNILYVADTVSNKIRRITPQGVVTTIAGTGLSGVTNGAGLSATFNAPTGIAVAANGVIYVIDSGSGKIRKLSPDS